MKKTLKRTVAFLCLALILLVNSNNVARPTVKPNLNNGFIVNNDLFFEHGVED